MSKKRNRVAIKADNVVFGVLVHDEPATVVCEHDIVRLCSNIDGSPYAFPPDFVVTPQMYGEEVDITIRDITNEVILEQGSNDFYEDELERDERLMLIETVDDLQELYNEKKIKMFMGAGKRVSTIIAGLVLSAVCIWFIKKGGFPFPIVVNIGAYVGIAVAAALGVVPLFKTLRYLNSDYIVDEIGSYVNMKTGKSNLNGGMTFRMSKREDRW